MDKAALLTAILQRNALRRQAQLPPLDVRAELDRAVARAALAEYQALCTTHKSDFYRILSEVIAAHPPRRTHFGTTHLHRIAQKKFETFLKERYGVTKPTDRQQQIIYGEAK